MFSNINFLTITSVLVIISSTYMAVFLFISGRGGRIPRALGLFCLSVTLWGVGGLIISLAKTQAQAVVCWKFAYVSVILTPVIFYRFICIFLAREQNYQKYILRVSYLLSGIFIAFAFFTQETFLGELRLVVNRFYWVQDTPVFLIFYISFYWLLLGYSLLMLIQAFIPSRGLKRNQLKYLIFGSIIGWIGAEGNFLPTLGFDIFPVSNVLIAIYTVIFAYAIIKYHLLDIRVAITRAGIFLLLYVPFLGVPFYLAHILRDKPSFCFLPVVYAVFFASLGPLIYRRLQAKAEAFLLAQQRRYQKILLQAAGGMVTEHKLDRLFRLIVYIIKRAVGIQYAAVFSFDKEESVYTLQASRGRFIDPLTSRIEGSSPLFSFLKKKGVPVTAEELSIDDRHLLEEKVGGQFDVIIPAIANGKLLALLVLGAKLDKSYYSQDDINVFRILSHQAALAVKNCLFFQEFKKVQEELFQAEKLASIGGIADGVAHQIKNRLNHFSLAGGEMKLAIADFLAKTAKEKEAGGTEEIFEYLKTLADSISVNVKKTDSIVKGILNFARTSEKDTYFGYFHIDDLISSAIGLLAVKHETSNVPLEKDTGSVEMIWGVKAQMNEVIYNLLDNAYEATQEMYSHIPAGEYDRYRPRIRIKAYETDTHYRFEISDNGIGIKETNRKKMFAPFFTTKSSYKSGSGIGMYVVRRIVEENHNGSIWFESEYKKGTTFFIDLPKPRKSQYRAKLSGSGTDPRLPESGA